MLMKLCAGIALSVLIAGCVSGGVDFSGDPDPEGLYPLWESSLSASCEGEAEPTWPQPATAEMRVQVGEDGGRTIWLQSGNWVLPFGGVVVGSDGSFDVWARYPSYMDEPVYEFRHLSGTFLISEFGEKIVDAVLVVYTFTYDDVVYSGDPACKYVSQLYSMD